MATVKILGGGLAGSEAAWQLALRGIDVELYEMRPKTMTGAHQTGWLAELVCSNSLRAAAIENAVGLLKEEMRQLGSLIIRTADACRVPAGGALAVDRELFSQTITQCLETNPRVRIIREEVVSLPRDGIIVVATGPLTSPRLAEAIKAVVGLPYLYFYDAVAPIVALESLDLSRLFTASRYNKGEAAYLNSPMTREEFERFGRELKDAETVPIRDFERAVYFEGCMPVEVLAARGLDTLRFGPMKPVGLIDPRTGQRPYAVVQLRQDNLAATLYNIVGFQTRLKWSEQERVFRLIPGLEKAEFVRLGVMHRNTYINSPALLLPTLQLRHLPQIFFAGQITGVEGYVESAAMGLVAGINAARLSSGCSPLVCPPETAHGALCHYISHTGEDNFQPMNVNFGIFPALPTAVKDRRKRNEVFAKRALTILAEFREKYDMLLHSSS